MNGSVPPRVLITPPAADLVVRLQQRHGPVMFHQSGGCCDGSSPMCFPNGEFAIGDSDVLLGILGVSSPAQPHGVPVWVDGAHHRLWQDAALVIDVVAGRGAGFSLEAPEGVRFLSRSRAVSPLDSGTPNIVTDTTDSCPYPAH